MKIKAKNACWMPNPELNWSAGEVKEVSEDIGKKLLINQNFSKVSDIKSETRQKFETNRKKYE